MTDWATISSLATAAGTLVLAVATFSSVRSANRAARAAERSLLAGLRPLLMPSRLEDPPEKFAFVDGHWVKLPGGRGTVEVADGIVYMGIALRNAGSGIAVLHGWFLTPERLLGDAGHVEPTEFHRLTRDIYVPAGDTGFWQGALRDPSDPTHAAVREAVAAGQAVTIDLLYGDHEGGQRTISRFSLSPSADSSWFVAVSRHWSLDRADPRQ
jgi:hypothetical protein